MLEYILSYLDTYPHSILYNGFYYHLKIIAAKKVSTIGFLQYKKYGTGQIIQLVESGADAGRRVLFDFYLNIFRKILPGVLIGMFFIGLYDYKVLLAVLISYGFVFLITKILLKKLYSVKNITLINEEIFSSKIVRAFMEMVIFRINRRYKSEIEKCTKKSSEIIKSKTKILMTHEMFFTSFAIIVAIIKMIAIFIGIKQVIAGTSSVGVIVALVALIDKVYAPIAIFNVEYVDYKLNKITLNRFETLINQPDDMMLSKGKISNINKGNISFENVSFDYTGIRVLDKISMNFESGKKYAIVGQSGAGKTTVLNLLSGLIKTTKGRIVIDGQNLSELNLNSYYKHIAYLSQVSAVFDGTIRENLVFDSDVSEILLWDALKKVNMDNRIKLMNEGLDEHIGEKGNLLSGGEKQRLALARVILLQPKILILDEPTSAIDSINEDFIMKNVFETLLKSTIIAITHKVYATHMFDNVILLDKCKIKAIATTEELLKTDELFQNLYKNDKLDITMPD